MTRKDKIRKEHSEGPTSEAGFKEITDTTEMVAAGDEKRRKTHSEESIEVGYTKKEEEKTTKSRWKKSCQ